MCEFKLNGKHFRAYNLGHAFCDGVEIALSEFYAALKAARVAAQFGGAA